MNLREITILFQNHFIAYTRAQLKSQFRGIKNENKKYFKNQTTVVNDKITIYVSVIKVAIIWLFLKFFVSKFLSVWKKKIVVREIISTPT